MICDITDSIGNTPLIEILKQKCAGTHLYIKLESFNPGGSIKDRVALRMINQCELYNKIKPGMELVEYRIDMPARLTESEQRRCSEYTISVLSALGLSHGIFHIEVILTASGPVLVEVNPRIMGSYMPLLFNNVTGNNIFSWLVDIHSGTALDQSTILKTDKVGSAIRFDVAKAGAYSPPAFKKLVESCFSPAYAELPGEQGIVNVEPIVSPGSTLTIPCSPGSSAKAGAYSPPAFKKLVESCFSPAYAELPGEQGIVNVEPGETIGRIQVIYPDHAALENDLTVFFSRVEQQLGLELLH